MPREAKLFESAEGSPVRALLGSKSTFRPTGSHARRRLAKEPRAGFGCLDEELAEIEEESAESARHDQGCRTGAENASEGVAGSRFRRSPSTTACVRCSRSAATARANADAVRSQFRSSLRLQPQGSSR